MPFEAKVICIVLIMGNFVLLLGGGCIFYVMLSRKRVQFCINKISAMAEVSKVNTETSISIERKTLDINAAILSLAANFVFCQ
jgi:hypothetical protein